MKRIIRDSQQRPIAQIVETASGESIYNGAGTKLLGNFNKSSNSTYSPQGRLVGSGNQLMRLIG